MSRNGFLNINELSQPPFFPSFRSFFLPCLSFSSFRDIDFNPYNQTTFHCLGSNQNFLNTSIKIHFHNRWQTIRIIDGRGRSSTCRSVIPYIINVTILFTSQELVFINSVESILIKVQAFIISVILHQLHNRVIKYFWSFGKIVFIIEKNILL